MTKAIKKMYISKTSLIVMENLGIYLNIILLKVRGYSIKSVLQGSEYI